MTDDNKPEPVSRSDRFILYFQLDGLCSALGMCMQTGQEPGPDTLGLLAKVMEDVQHNVKGRALSNLPALSDHPCLADILALAEFLRSTILSFLSSEEAEEGKEMRMGFGRN